MSKFDPLVEVTLNFYGTDEEAVLVFNRLKELAKKCGVESPNEDRCESDVSYGNSGSFYFSFSGTIGSITSFLTAIRFRDRGPLLDTNW